MPGSNSSPWRARRPWPRTRSCDDATAAVRARVRVDTHTVDRLFDREQRATHGLAWLATYVEGIRQVGAFAERAHVAGALSEIKELLVAIGIGEFLAQILGGIPMSQGEIVRPADLGLSIADVAARLAGPLESLIDRQRAAPRAAGDAAARPQRSHHRRSGDDEALMAMREEVRKFAESEVMPHAHGWHLANQSIPLDVIAQMAELGVFGLTIPEQLRRHGPGQGGDVRRHRGIVARLYRRRLARHALRDRRRADRWQRHRGAEAPLAAEDRRPARCCRRRCSPSPTSAPISRRSRPARRVTGDVYLVHGNKTWITHAARADLMVLLVRTNPAEPGYQGLSLLLAEKPRGTDADPFPAPGMSGTEIEVLGYRGMKEYEIAFDGFEVPAAEPARRRRGPRLQAADADLRGGAHPDRGARRRRRAGRDGDGAPIRARAQAVRRADRQFPARRRQDRDDGGGDLDGAAAHLLRGAPQGFRPALRSRGRDGEAPGRARRVGGGRQRGADPRRQRLCARISGVAAPVRRAHPVDLRRRRRNPGQCHCAPAAG